MSSGEVNKKRIYKTDTYITQLGFDKCSTKMVPKNTVVMALAGQGKTRGMVAITEIELCTNQSLAAIVTNDKINDYFLLYYLETQYNNLRAISSGDGTRGGLNLQLINTYKVAIPQYNEQDKISIFFKLIDKRIELHRKLIDNLKSYKRGVLNDIFSQKISFSLDEITDWQSVKISDCLSYEQPQKYIVNSENYSNEYFTPVLTANKAFILGYTNELDGIYKKGNVIIYDDFTMDTKYVDFDFKVKSSTIKILTPKKDVDLYFMYNYFQYLNLVPEGHQRSYISIIEHMVIEIPNYDIQKQIAGFLNKVDLRIKNQQEQLIKMSNLKNGLLQQMFI